MTSRKQLASSLERVGDTRWRYKQDGKSQKAVVFSPESQDFESVRVEDTQGRLGGGSLESV